MSTSCILQSLCCFSIDLFWSLRK
ncbi:hypothetical protein ACHAXS_002955 [Conticribra weissflogii]